MTNTPAVVRTAVETDLPAIARLESGVFSHNAYPPFFFRQAYDVLGQFLLVAEDSAGGIAGYCLGAVEARGVNGWVLSIAVRPEMQRRGIGSSLMRELLIRLEASGASYARLTVEPENTPAIAAYEKLGFRVLATDPDYFGPGEARTIMEKAMGKR